MVAPDRGVIRLGTNVHIGYYDQEHHVLHNDKTVFEEISDEYPAMTNTEIRNLLASFLFTGEDVFKRIGDLSGGEKGRVSLAKLMLSKANFLILDEPTNHLDLVSKEVLENALNSYEGTVLYVSHDRYFINRTASRILSLTQRVLLNYPGNNAEKAPERFIGNYDFYLEKSSQVEEALLKDAYRDGQGSDPLPFIPHGSFFRSSKMPSPDPARKNEIPAPRKNRAGHSRKKNRPGRGRRPMTCANAKKRSQESKKRSRRSNHRWLCRRIIPMRKIFPGCISQKESLEEELAGFTSSGKL